MYLRLLASASCVVVCGLLPRGGLIAQGAPTPDGAPPRWVSATRPWLLGQIIPNRLVPDPDPSRRRLVISYDLAPAEFPRRKVVADHQPRSAEHTSELQSRPHLGCRLL